MFFNINKIILYTLISIVMLNSDVVLGNSHIIDRSKDLNVTFFANITQSTPEVQNVSLQLNSFLTTPTGRTILGEPILIDFPSADITQLELTSIKVKRPAVDGAYVVGYFVKETT